MPVKPWITGSGRPVVDSLVSTVGCDNNMIKCFNHIDLLCLYLNYTGMGVFESNIGMLKLSTTSSSSSTSTALTLATEAI